MSADGRTAYKPVRVTLVAPPIANKAPLYRRIAADPRIATPGVASRLPTGWTLLYRISRLDDEEFQRRLDDGTIRPDMKRSDLGPALDDDDDEHEHGDADKDESGSRGTSDEWFTPAPVLAVARDVLGHFDLDPASCAEAQRNVQASRYFSVADDGLEQAWEGRVWLNPPYSQPLLDQFVTKLIDEVKGQRVTEAILLMANKPIITWYKALRACSAQCLWNGRIMFEHLSGSTQSAQYGSAVFYFGDRVEEFARRFAQFGQVVRPDRGPAFDDGEGEDEIEDDDRADDSDEWYTPANILDAVRDVLGTIDLDPASCPEAQATVQATRYFTIEDDGLKQEWRGRVWLNGPFSHPLNIRFVNKLIAEVASGRVSKAIMLVNILPSAWLQEAITICSAVCFSRDRLRFTHQTGKIQINNHNLVIFYFGPDVEKFVRRFAEFGRCLR